MVRRAMMVLDKTEKDTISIYRKGHFRYSNFNAPWRIPVVPAPGWLWAALFLLA